MIRAIEQSDAQYVADIYNHYVLNTAVTFEEEQVTTLEMAARINECSTHDLPWLVAIDEGKIVGYCYASKWKGRCAYRHSVEATVYLSPTAVSKGWGTQLYKQLLSQLTQQGIHAVICGIALPNDASIALHEKFGMQKVAHFKQVGRKFNSWIDVGYWQCLLT